MATKILADYRDKKEYPMAIIKVYPNCKGLKFKDLDEWWLITPKNGKQFTKGGSMTQQWWGKIKQKILRNMSYEVVDHIKVVKDGLEAYPYQSHMNDLKQLINFCEKEGLRFYILAKSSYGAGTHTIKIILP